MIARWLTSFVVFIGSGSLACFAASPTMELANEFVQRKILQESLQAEIDSKSLEGNTQNLAGTVNFSLSNLMGFEALSVDSQQFFGKLMQKNTYEVTTSLEEYILLSRRRSETLESDWKTVRGKSNQLRIEFSEAGTSGKLAGYIALLASTENRWIWWSCCWGLLFLAFILWHSRRHDYRRWQNGTRVRVLGLSNVVQYFTICLTGLSLTMIIFGPALYDWMIRIGSNTATSSLNSLKNELSELDGEIQTTRSRLEKLTSSAHALDVQIPMLTQDLLRLHTKLNETYQHALMEQRIARHLQDEIKTLREVQARREKQISEINLINRMRTWTKLLMGSGMLIALSCLSMGIFRNFRDKNRVIANTCPQCLSVGQLKRLPQTPGISNVEQVECTHVLSESPFEECRFRFPIIYREMSKLCFPTLGHPTSGKTHWLSMVYRELNRGNYDQSVRFERVRSQASENLDSIVNEILSQRLGPLASQTNTLPCPVIFHFSDRDPLGVSNILANIFDYSGEITTRRTLDDHHRRRALSAEGYFFFLDPTLPSDDQNTALLNFREDIRLLRNVSAGGVVHAPVALCISKIDLLTTQPYANPSGGDAVENFYKQLGEIDPTGEDMSLQVMRQRSELMRRMCDTIWPGWNIERLIHEFFGGRYMFFPLTPVGLGELGEMDLRDRVIEPYCILQPLVWLLHMNGYRVTR